MSANNARVSNLYEVQQKYLDPVVQLTAAENWQMTEVVLWPAGLYLSNKTTRRVKRLHTLVTVDRSQHQILAKISQTQLISNAKWSPVIKKIAQKVAIKAPKPKV